MKNILLYAMLTLYSGASFSTEKQPPIYSASEILSYVLQTEHIDGSKVKTNISYDPSKEQWRINITPILEVKEIQTPNNGKVSERPICDDCSRDYFVPNTKNLSIIHGKKNG